MMRHFLMAIFVVLLSLPCLAQSNQIYMNDFEIVPDSIMDFSLMLANESPTRGLQYTMKLPQGLFLEDMVVTAYSQHYRMTISCNDLGNNSYLVFVFPNIRICYPPDTAAIVTISLRAASDFKGGDVLIVDCAGSTIDSQSFPIVGDTVHVTVPASSLIRIPMDQQPVKDQYFNLLGAPIHSATDVPIAIHVTTSRDGRRDCHKVSMQH